MLGIAASNSIAVPKGFLNQIGAVSVKNRAIPKLTGTAIISAIAEVINVPIMGTSAPNLSLTGSHSSMKRNFSPKVLIDGHAPMTKEKRIPTNNTSTKKAKNWLVWRNKKSRKGSFFIYVNTTPP